VRIHTNATAAPDGDEHGKSFYGEFKSLSFFVTLGNHA